MKKIKVMHFVSGLLSGGVEQMLYNYCKLLSHDKYQFIIVYQHEPVESCISKVESIGCKTIRITARNENFFQNIKDSINVINAEKPDIVHAHMNLMNFCALYAAKKNGVKVRISHSHIAEMNKPITYQAMAVVCKKLCEYYATDYFACGQEAGEYLYGHKKMVCDKVQIMKNAIDLKYYKKDEKLNFDFRNKYNLLDKFILGHIGRFSAQKNHERLIDIFCGVLKKRPDAFLLLIGTGELETKIRKKVEDLKISDKVLFYGTTSNMKEIYSAIDTLVLPSIFEGLPVVSIEVQAANIPAVFSDTIAKTCKVTNAIEFCSLEKTDADWAEKIVNHYNLFKPCDLEGLYSIYDISINARKLDSYYENSCKRYQSINKTL